MNSTPLWRTKANRLIAILSLKAFRDANPLDGKKHKPYEIPALASELVTCLEIDDELTAMALFMNYEGAKACSS